MTPDTECPNCDAPLELHEEWAHVHDYAVYFDIACDKCNVELLIEVQATPEFYPSIKED